MTPACSRRRRNLELARAHRLGLGVRALARLTRLSPAQVAAILAQLEREEAEKTEQAAIYASIARLGT